MGFSLSNLKNGHLEFKIITKNIKKLNSSYYVSTKGFNYNNRKLYYYFSLFYFNLG